MALDSPDARRGTAILDGPLPSHDRLSRSSGTVVCPVSHERHGLSFCGLLCIRVGPTSVHIARRFGYGIAILLTYRHCRLMYSQSLYHLGHFCHVFFPQEGLP
jgi:hypothetical protein